MEDLLGKPVQSELAAETGLDVALDALVDVGNSKLMFKIINKKMYQNESNFILNLKMY